MKNYASKFNDSYPPAAQTFEQDSITRKIGGYSFLVKLLPYLDNDVIYRELPPSLGRDGKVLRLSNQDRPINPLRTVIAKSMYEFVCPSYAGQLYNQSSLGATPQQAITNYKAMGASCKQSLAFAQYVDPKSSGGPVPYGTAAIHPDGAIYPSSNNIPSALMLDGESQTIFLCETIDSTASCWMFGSECVLTGLPGAGPNSQGTPCSVPTGSLPVSPYTFFTPAQYDGTFGDSSGVTRGGLRTFLMYDCHLSGADAGAYAHDGDPGSAWETTDQGSNYPAYGPSSFHPGVAIVGFGDASVQPLSKRTDAALFFFLITKANADSISILGMPQ